jgi:hypothetical protein
MAKEILGSRSVRDRGSSVGPRASEENVRRESDAFHRESLLNSS